MTRALIIVDPQVDFAEGGSLAVPGAAQVYSDIYDYVKERGHEWYRLIFSTLDDHIDPGEHWSETPNYVDSWPKHCEQGTLGWYYHPNIYRALDYVDSEFSKGQYTAAYSGFEGVNKLGMNLDDMLKLFDIEELDIVGNEFSNCVRATAVDGAKLGYKVTVLYDLCAKLHENNTETFIEFDKYGILGG